MSLFLCFILMYVDSNYDYDYDMIFPSGYMSVRTVLPFPRFSVSRLLSSAFFSFFVIVKLPTVWFGAKFSHSHRVKATPTSGSLRKHNKKSSREIIAPLPAHIWIRRWLSFVACGQTASTSTRVQCLFVLIFLFVTDHGSPHCSYLVCTS